jgi:AraC-like DNA-binding protein
MQVSILMVSVLAGVIERVGASREQFLREARIEPHWLEDGAMRLPLETYFYAVDAAIAVSGDPAFGLHMGEQSRAAMFGVTATVAEHAPTLRQAIEMMQRYARIMADCGFEPELHESADTAVLRFPAMTGGGTAMRMTTEFVMTSLTSMLPVFARGSAHPLQVRFVYAPPPYLSEYQRIFRGAERFEQKFTEMLLPRAWLDGPQPASELEKARSPELFELLKDQAERSIVRLERGASLREQVERLTIKHGPRSLTVEGVARELGMSSRSLRRRLSDEGLTFTALVVSYRTSMAKRILERPDASLQETAYELGFASPSAFHRAFKRWTGMTPKEYQESF